ncbi:hypothetical protein FLK61_23970 [Paenalkalicoccus suaedae]|uniref:Uncharacterized protein n=1 Tax=Paenalkalicoccus suaedae TaxID=2592382 RepID=A0A859FA99_9BACI|nr:hypothetical protein [Paenalkalicoccus suaedae]QKS69847.1 hypothetical protein FLK61_23970 [Paenalkalicoccus suaedae]
MRIRYTVPLVAVIITIIIGFIILDSSTENIVQGGDTTNVLFSDADEMEAYADIVIEVVATNDNTHVSRGEFDGHTLTKVEVLEVFKNNTGKDIGPYMAVAEPYYVSDRIIGHDVITYGDYMPLEEDGNYILFLSWAENIEGYWIVSLEQGQIKLGEDASDDEQTEFRSEQYQNLIESVKEKYNKN